MDTVEVTTPPSGITDSCAAELSKNRLQFKRRIRSHLHWIALRVGTPLLCCLAFFATSFSPVNHCYAQDAPKAVAQFTRTGTIRAVKNGELTIRHKDGKRLTYKIQDKDEEGLSLEGKHILSFPARIKVNGTLPADLLEKGMLVKFESSVNKFGKQKEDIEKLNIVDLKLQDYNIDIKREPVDKDDFVDCKVQGRIIQAIKGRITVAVPKKFKLASQNRIKFDLSPDATFEISDDNLNRVRVGDTVRKMQGVELSDGTLVIVSIDIALTAKRKRTTFSFHEQLEQKFSHLSDEPRAPREVRSQHFVLYTDISNKSSSILLAKLETMFELVSEYYSRPQKQVIECYVVEDVSKWNGRLPREALIKIAEGAGVTATMSNGRQAKAIVYSCDDHDVVQHEAVHAFCGQAFGSPGPVWYAEGMAEMGQYWRPEKLEVNIDPVVIEYLRHAKPKKLLDIIKEDEISGDSWQAYAWRWAICHLMVNHSAYSQDFKRLGMRLMMGKEGSFKSMFGDKSNRIAFEYHQFIENFGNGYRVDLCEWDWNHSTISNIQKNWPKARIKAKAGWQSTRLRTRKGLIYDYVAQEGTWKISEDGKPLNADGNVDGEGLLVGRIFNDYRLSKPIYLGTRGRFKAPASGQLYLRCNDEWTDLANNSGEITCVFRLSSVNKHVNAEADKKK